jgi:hypothetical protein
MTPTNFKYITIILFGFYATTVISQQKYEKESHLNPIDVPTAALEFIDALELTETIKWYFEEGLESNTIEAKFKLNNKKHSVEFDTAGGILDIEKEIKWKELQPELQNTIKSALSGICSKHKISKIQIHFSGSQNVLISLLKGKEITDNFTTKYEIIAKCVNKNKTEQFEYLFNSEGILLKTSEIIFKNSSNLEY